MISRPRREFSGSTKREAFARSGGICECHRIPWMIACGLPLGTGNVFYEHLICDGLDGEPTLENCAALCKTCWRIKTSDYDLPVIAKAKRNFNRDINAESMPYRPLPGTKRSGIALPFRGGPIDRRTNGPLFSRVRSPQNFGGRRT